MLNQLFWIVPICSVIALLFAWFFFKGMMKESEGNETMKRIAGHVRKGAMAYLRQQYKIVGLVFLVLCLFFAWMAWSGIAERLGMVCLFDRWFFFRIGWFYRNENSHLCFGPNGECGQPEHERRFESGFPFGSCNGFGGSRTGFAGYFFVVAGTGLLCRRSQCYPQSSDDYDYHADFRYGGFYPSLICPCRGRYFY